MYVLNALQGVEAVNVDAVGRTGPIDATWLYCNCNFKHARVMSGELIFPSKLSLDHSAFL